MVGREGEERWYKKDRLSIDSIQKTASVNHQHLSQQNSSSATLLNYRNNLNQPSTSLLLKSRSLGKRVITPALFNKSIYHLSTKFPPQHQKCLQIPSPFPAKSPSSLVPDAKTASVQPLLSLWLEMVRPSPLTTFPTLQPRELKLLLRKSESKEGGLLLYRRMLMKLVLRNWLMGRLGRLVGLIFWVRIYPTSSSSVIFHLLSSFIFFTCIHTNL